MALRRSDPQPMTYDEYCLLPDDGKRYQVIEGELFVNPLRQTVSVYGRNGDRFVLKREVIEDDTVASDVVTGFQTSAQAVFV